jgi:hypothetical protein
MWLPLDVVPILSSLSRKADFNRCTTQHGLLTILDEVMMTHH